MNRRLSFRSPVERLTTAFVLCLPLLAGCNNRMEAHPVDPNLARFDSQASQDCLVLGKVSLQGQYANDIHLLNVSASARRLQAGGSPRLTGAKR